MEGTIHITDEQAAVIRELYARFFKNDDGTPYTIFDYNIPIAYEVIYGENPRTLIVSPTQSGKTKTLATATILYCLKHRNQSIIELAPRGIQNEYFTQYLHRHICDHPYISEQLYLDRKRTAENIGKEVSQRRLTWKTGCDLKYITAEGSAERLLGAGAGLIILDQSESIPDKVYRAMILRMLGNRKNARIIELINPIHLNHIYESYNDPYYQKVVIDWRQCVRAGRFTTEYIARRKQELTADEFTMYYEGKFVENPDRRLIPASWVMRAVMDKPITITKGQLRYGLDVGELGPDFTVLTKLRYFEGKFYVPEIVHWGQKDPAYTIGKVKTLVGREDPINIDATGVGSGVYAVLKSMDYSALGLRVGCAPQCETHRFLNLKSQVFWNLRTLFEEGRIKIPNHPRLIQELKSMEYDINHAGKIVIVDPEKSPDFADSLAYGVFGVVEPITCQAF